MEPLTNLAVLEPLKVKKLSREVLREALLERAELVEAPPEALQRAADLSAERVVWAVFICTEELSELRARALELFDERAHLLEREARDHRLEEEDHSLLGADDRGALGLKLGDLWLLEQRRRLESARAAEVIPDRLLKSAQASSQREIDLSRCELILREPLKELVEPFVGTV